MTKKTPLPKYRSVTVVDESLPSLHSGNIRAVITATRTYGRLEITGFNSSTDGEDRFYSKADLREPEEIFDSLAHAASEGFVSLPSREKIAALISEIHPKLGQKLHDYTEQE